MYQSSRYFNGQGSLFIRPASGTNSSLRHVGNVTEIMLNTQQSFTDHKEAQTGERRIDLRINTQTTVTGTIMLESTVKENWQLALKASAVDAIGATVTAEKGTAPAAGGGNGFALARKNISSITAITSDPVATTYVAGTDYVASPPSNVIMVPTGSTLAAKPFLANYVCGSSEVIGVFNANPLDYYLYFDGLNTVENKNPVVVEVFKCNFDSAAQIALISDNLTGFSLNFTALYDVKFDTPGAVDDGGYFRVTQMKLP